jgi:transposase-like protein
MSDQPSDWIKDLYARPATTTTPSTEIAPSAKRPARSAAQRLRIVEEYDSDPTGAPQHRAILRHLAIYTSQIAKWRKLRTKGALAALTSQPPGPKPAPREALLDQVKQLRLENARLQAGLAQQESVIEVQKKVAALLGANLPSTTPDGQ